jgi:DNA-binding protein YbaB
MFNDIDAAEEWLNTWTASVNAQAERAAQLTSRVAALTANAQSADGAIRVTVGSTGQIEKLTLDDRVQRLSGEELSRQILGVMRKAQASLSTLVTAEVAATVGVDTETGRAVIGSFETRFPQPADDDRDPRDGRGGEHRGR